MHHSMEQSKLVAHQPRRRAAWPRSGCLHGQVRALPVGCMPVAGRIRRRTLRPLRRSFCSSLSRCRTVSRAGAIVFGRLRMPRCLSWRLAVLVLPLLCFLNLLPAAQHLYVKDSFLGC